MGAGTAWASVTDNMVPTANYSLSCRSSTLADPALCQTDNAVLTAYIQDSVGAALSISIHASLDDSYNGTALNVSYPATAVYSGTAETDIIYQVGDIPYAGLIGYAWCNNAPETGSPFACDQQYVRIESGYTSRALACHETGHAVGLTHGANASPQLINTDSRLGCLVTPVNNTLQYLGPNNVDAINAAY